MTHSAHTSQSPSAHEWRPRSLDVRLDVTGTPGISGDVDVAATVFLPRELSDGVPLIVAFPGGGYNRRYFSIDKLPGYNQAAYHTSQGVVFVAIDHLGVGESAQPDPFFLSFESLAAANDLAVKHLLAGLRDGSFLDGVRFAPNAVIGVGQSMGGCLLTVQQANHRTFDAVGFLGWSAIATTFPSPEGGRFIFPNPKRGTDLRQFAGLEFGPSAKHFRFGFHWPDEPPELIEADLRSLSSDEVEQMAGNDAIEVAPSGRVRGDAETPWGSATIPPVALCMAGEGIVSAEAAAIDVPVLVAAGDRDFLADPWAEPSLYRNSREITVVVVPQMAHMHNFAPTRAQLWSHIQNFCAGIRSRTTTAVPL